MAIKFEASPISVGVGAAVDIGGIADESPLGCGLIGGIPGGPASGIGGPEAIGGIPGGPAAGIGGPGAIGGIPGGPAAGIGGPEAIGGV